MTIDGGVNKVGKCRKRTQVNWMNKKTHKSRSRKRFRIRGEGRPKKHTNKSKGE
jgi:hypothetical protein